MNVQDVLDRLQKLVAFDTQNPPRELDAASPIFSYLSESLGTGFTIDVTLSL